MTWDNLSADGLPEGTKAVVNLAGQNVLDPLRFNITILLYKLSSKLFLSVAKKLANR